MTSKTSTICNQGPIPVEYIIPLSGNHFSTYTHYKEDTKKRTSLSWIFQYCYGLRPKDADVIYCTFNRVVSSVTEDNRYNEKYRRIED
jgi:hypothetical protein